MIISKDKTITDDEYNNLQWEKLPTTPDTLTDVFSGKEILSAEAVGFPLTDGVVFCLLDDERQMVFVTVAVSDALLYGADADCETPLVLRVSEAVTFDPSP